MSATATPEIDRIQGTLEPAGYRVLVRVPHLDAQMKRHADLHMPEGTRQLEEAAQLVGQVISLGPDAYKDETKFPTGPWCRPGDYIMMRAYAGTRFVMQDEATGEKTTYALVNDDSVQAVVKADVLEGIGRG